MKPVIDHLQITVKDIRGAEVFYDKLMPLLGFDLKHKHKGSAPSHEFEAIEYAHPLLVIGINSPRSVFRDEDVHRRKPGSVHHIAFKAESPAQVDELYPAIKDAGAVIVEPPRFYPEHGPAYYALYFKDPDGIKYEIVHEERSFD